jgi:hypothetical protein
MIAGGNGSLDLGVEPPRIGAQPRCHRFQVIAIAPPLVALSSALAKTLLDQAHSQFQPLAPLDNPASVSTQPVEMALKSG